MRREKPARSRSSKNPKNPKRQIIVAAAANHISRQVEDDPRKTTSMDSLVRSRESVAELEWDDAGIQMKEDEEEEGRRLWRRQAQQFEHSIVRWVKKLSNMRNSEVSLPLKV